MNRKLRPAAILVAAVALAAVAGCDFLAKDKVKTRVTSILEGMHRDNGGTGPEMQMAISQWRYGQSNIGDQGLLTAAYDQFTVWSREKGLTGRIGTYAIVSMEAVSGAVPKTYIVTVTIDGTTYKMKVPDGEAISWSE